MSTPKPVTVDGRTALVVQIVGWAGPLRQDVVWASPAQVRILGDVAEGLDSDAAAGRQAPRLHVRPALPSEIEEERTS